MTSRVLLPLSFTVLAAACVSSAPEQPRARFAEATDAERTAAIHAGVGLGPAAAFSALLALQQDAIQSVREDGCLDVTATGTDPVVLTIVADDCVGSSGTRWDGRVVAENASLFDELMEVVDGDGQIFEGAMRLQFEGFSMSGDGASLRLDGEIAQSETVPGEPYTAAVDLDITVGEIGFGTYVSYDCEWHTEDAVRCEVLANGAASVTGFGRFDVSGTFSVGGPETAPSGALVLTAADELRVDFGTRDDEGCARVTIDGEATEPFCMAPQSAPPAHQMVNGGAGCSIEAWVADATVAGEGVAAVRATFYHAASDARGPEVHPLVRRGATSLGATWELTVPITDEYASGEGSTIGCAVDDRGAVTSADVLLEALDAEGKVLACMTAGPGTFLPVGACLAR